MGDSNRNFCLIMVWFLLRDCEKWHKWDIHRLSLGEPASKTLFSVCATFIEQVIEVSSSCLSSITIVSYVRLNNEAWSWLSSVSQFYNASKEAVIEISVRFWNSIISLLDAFNMERVMDILSSFISVGGSDHITVPFLESYYRFVRPL